MCVCVCVCVCVCKSPVHLHLNCFINKYQVLPRNITGPASCDMMGNHSNPPKHLFTVKMMIELVG